MILNYLIVFLRAIFIVADFFLFTVILAIHIKVFIVKANECQYASLADILGIILLENLIVRQSERGYDIKNDCYQL